MDTKMKFRWVFYILLLFFMPINASWKASNDEFVGCFKTLTPDEVIPPYPDVNICVETCFKYYYRYFLLFNNKCTCENVLGQQLSNLTCGKYCDTTVCTGKMANVYTTGVTEPGPPKNVIVTSITSDSVWLRWEEPVYTEGVIGYQALVSVLKSYNDPTSYLSKYIYTRGTRKAHISNLSSATTYNISVCSLSDKGLGGCAAKILSTKLKEPSHLPQHPVLINKTGDKITINIPKTRKSNGPVSCYRIIVVKTEDNQAVQKTSLMPYLEAKKNKLSYYVAAEIDPKDFNNYFTIGDGKSYGNYYNAPLDPHTKYDILMALVSSYNGETKIVYSSASYFNGVAELKVGNQYEVYNTDIYSSLRFGVSIAIALTTFLLLMAFVTLTLLKMNFMLRLQRRHRVVSVPVSQEIALRDPNIDIESNRFINEDHPAFVIVNRFAALKDRINLIYPGLLKIEDHEKFALGKFGSINTGILDQNDEIPVICYNIDESKLDKEGKTEMLNDLETLIKVKQHEFILNLLGTTEIDNSLTVVLEYAPGNLKDMVLLNRENPEGEMMNMTENQLIEILMGISNGMSYLHSLEINHNQLCARSVMMVGLVPKISNFGLAQYFLDNKIPNYVRWTALEIFNGAPATPKSDTWSFACLMWEVTAMGATPYASIVNDVDLPEQLTNGLRLEQLDGIGDELFQFMMNCWQTIPDGRPNFDDILNALKYFYINAEGVLKFQQPYEPYYSTLELLDRPVL